MYTVHHLTGMSGVVGVETVVAPQDDTEESPPDPPDEHKVRLCDLEDVLERSLLPTCLSPTCHEE